MLQWFIRFPKFDEFNKSSAPFRKNSIDHDYFSFSDTVWYFIERYMECYCMIWALCFRPVWHGLFQLSHLHVEHLTNESHFRNVITHCVIDTEINITLTAIFNLFLPKWNLTENEDAKNINMDSHSFPEYCQVYSKALLLRMKCFTAKRL